MVKLTNFPKYLMAAPGIKVLSPYTLTDDLLSTNITSNWNFYTGADPTGGFVDYIDEYSPQFEKLVAPFPAPTSNITGRNTTGMNLGVDTLNKTPQGRPSVRAESKKTFPSGLFVADIGHMPASVCGTWPAFWMVGPNWPQDGEVDIIEYVNKVNFNNVALHSGPGCQMAEESNVPFNGTIQNLNCDSTVTNLGCGVRTYNQSDHGTAFNENGGGVFVTEIDPKVGISVWFFTRQNLPVDITNPATYHEPVGFWPASACTVGSFFKQLRIVINTTFCGQWGEVDYKEGPCMASGQTCENWVANNPGQFEDTYWSINSLKVYQKTA